MNRSLLPCFALVLLLLTACGEPGLAPAPNAGDAGFTLLLTDAPASEASWLRVDFGRIDLVPADDGGVVTVSEDGGTIENLLELRNGVTTPLVEDLPIPDGSYAQIRLVVEAVTIAFGEEGEERVYDVTVPSGAESGLKIAVEPALRVQDGLASRVVLDFDATRAVVEAPPGSGRYLLRPTGIRAVTAAGVLQGVVRAGEIPVAGATVDVYETARGGAPAEGATPLVGTVTESDGSFRLVTLPEGIYALEVGADGYAPLVLGDIEVRTDGTTDLGAVALEPAP